MIKLKQSIARTLPVMLIDNADHIAPKTGVAEGDVTVVISKNGGALTAFTLTDKWTELGQGLYTIDFAIGDLDTVGFFAYLVTSAGCDQYSGMMYVEDFTDYMADVSLLALEATAQSIKASTDNLPADPADQSAITTTITNAHTVTDAKIDTAQDALDYLRQKESGRWKITGNQLIFYENDNVTPLRTFDLKDKEGNPTDDNPYERVPI